ncbi:hypothetical protein [Metabacillus malikii]|uniref:Uncharacterized protein n=1 Tax=Metabacillus malikii TaxID=1504265 RepID=A0ABT9ZM59_9BACI|nr:hypothetical protein [Metabacillus malikii]MDQ0232882.1 hypothetical protein [Metabacillus malikii]
MESKRPTLDLVMEPLEETIEFIKITQPTVRPSIQIKDGIPAQQMGKNNKEE